jgi:N-acetylmuramoyl-L-alanine amidase
MEIISRERWGAVHARGFGPAPLPARELWLHHSVTSGGGVTASFATDCASLRLLEQIGQARFSGGISYTFAVTESGRVFEGHGVDRKGAHTGGRNSIARAIVLVGDYSKRAPTDPQLSAVAELVAFGDRAGWWPGRLNGGHRDAPGAQTACPGDQAYRCIRGLNIAAERLLEQAPPTPSRPSAPVPDDRSEDDLTPEQDHMLRVVFDELTKRLPNRRGPGGAEQANGGAETLLGYAANADGAGYRAAWDLEGLRQQVEAVGDMVAGLGQQAAAQRVGAAAPIDYDQLISAWLRRTT